MRLVAAILAAAVLAACNDDSRSPAGIDLIPGGVLGEGLEVVVVRDFDLAVDATVFPGLRGTADRLVTATGWPAEPGFESRALFRFEFVGVDSLPAGTSVLASRLRLVFSPIPPQEVTLTVHRVLADWDEEAASWNRRDFGAPWAQMGGDFDPEPLAELTIGGEVVDPDSVVADTVEVALPEGLVGDWFADRAANDGLALVQRTPGEAVTFVSSGPLGVNPNAPQLEVEVELGEPGSPSAILTFFAREDTFLALDRAPLETTGLTVTAGDPVTRAYLEPDLGSVPIGSAVVAAQLIVSVDAARVPGDSIRLVANQIISDFRGEKTVLAPATASTILGLATVAADALPIDSLVFQSTRLANLVRLWLREPEANQGIAITIDDEATAFGGIAFFAPDAPLVELRPRLRLVVLPPSEPMAGAP